MENVKPKLYLNMIIAEYEPVDMVKRGIDSVKDYVDGMYMTVTYSDVIPETSALVELLRSYGAEVSFFKWTDDYAEARNFALSKVPQGKDIYIYWQDADDVLKGAKNLRDVFEDAVKLGWSSVFMVYWYRVALDENKEVKEIIIEQQRERIVVNDGTFSWRGMLHETLIGRRVENLKQYLRKECIVVHLTEDHRIDASLERNIRILEKQLEAEKHKDPRTLVYLGKAYYDKGLTVQNTITDKDEAVKVRESYFDKSVDLLTEYLTGKGEIGTEDYIEQSGWKEERASGWEYLMQIYLMRNDLERALYCINQAIEESPLFPQYYIAKAMIYVEMKDYKVAKHWLMLATNVDMPKTTMMTAPRNIKMRALECDARIAMAEQDLKRCSEDYNQLLEVEPDNEIYKNNLIVADSINAANKASQSIVFLGRYLSKIGEEDKILPLIQSVPQDLRKEPFYAEMRHKHIPPRLWEDNEIAILCGPGFEQWSPNSITKGLGGSEEAVVYLSQELTRVGWKVTVYANPEAEEGDFDGVAYENYYKFNPEDLFNHLIIWRGIGFTDIKPRTRGKTILWMHDMPNIADFTKERLDRVDKIAVLSEFHKKQIKMDENGTYVEIPDDKFFLTRNGIPDLGITSWKGNPHRMCYVSSPDRGLIYLLKMWPKIKEAVPDAELHVYYGFDVYDFIHRGNPAKKAFKEKILSMMKQEGITYHGRLGHKELAEEVNKCGVWAYPTDFDEISCISAMKCQALGAVPCVTNKSALQETVKNGIKVDVDIQDKTGQQAYVEALINLLQHPEEQEDLRNMSWAQSYFSWANVAEQWTTLLRTGNAPTTAMMSPAEWIKYLAAKKSEVKK